MADKDKLKALIQETAEATRTLNPRISKVSEGNQVLEKVIAEESKKFATLQGTFEEYLKEVKLSGINRNKMMSEQWQATEQFMTEVKERLKRLESSKDDNPVSQDRYDNLQKLNTELSYKDPSSEKIKELSNKEDSFSKMNNEAVLPPQPSTDASVTLSGAQYNSIINLMMSLQGTNVVNSGTRNQERISKAIGPGAYVRRKAHKAAQVAKATAAREMSSLGGSAFGPAFGLAVPLASKLLSSSLKGILHPKRTVRGITDSINNGITRASSFLGFGKKSDESIELANQNRILKRMARLLKKSEYDVKGDTESLLKMSSSGTSMLQSLMSWVGGYGPMLTALLGFAGIPAGLALIGTICSRLDEEARSAAEKQLNDAKGNSETQEILNNPMTLQQAHTNIGNKYFLPPDVEKESNGGESKWYSPFTAFGSTVESAWARLNMALGRGDVKTSGSVFKDVMPFLKTNTELASPELTYRELFALKGAKNLKEYNSLIANDAVHILSREGSLTLNREAQRADPNSRLGRGADIIRRVSREYDHTPTNSGSLQKSIDYTNQTVPGIHLSTPKQNPAATIENPLGLPQPPAQHSTAVTNVTVYNSMSGGNKTSRNFR